MSGQCKSATAQKARTPSRGTSVDWNSRKRNVKLQSVQCTLWPQTPKQPLLFLLSFSAMWLPVIYLLPEHVGPFAQHSSACPPQHMKASATAVLDGAKWVPDGKVFCVYMCVCVSSHIREQLLLYEWPESHPQGNVGETVQDGRERVGVAYCMWKHVRYPQRSWYAPDLYVFMLAHGKKCRLVLHYALSTITAETQKELCILCICAKSCQFSTVQRLLINQLWSASILLLIMHTTYDILWKDRIILMVKDWQSAHY